MNQRKHLLEAADSLVNGDRNAQYGDPIQDFDRIAALWNTYLTGVFERQIEVGEQTRIDPHDVAWMQILVKASRVTHSPDKEDHYVDVAGYAACGWDCVTSKEPF